MALARRLLLSGLWLMAVIGVVVAIGLRVRAYRLADPAQMLRPYLGWTPDGFSSHAVLVGRSMDRSGLTLQFELGLGPGEIRVLAERNRMQEVDTPLIGSTAVRWVLESARRPGALTLLMAPERGGVALLTVLDPRPE